MKRASMEISTGTAARMLGVSKMTVLRMLDDGTLRGRRDPHSGYWKVDYDSVMEYLNQPVNTRP